MMPNGDLFESGKAGKRIRWRLIECERRKNRMHCRLKKPCPNNPKPNVIVVCMIPLDGEVHTNYGRNGYRRVDN